MTHSWVSWSGGRGHHARSHAIAALVARVCACCRVWPATAASGLVTTGLYHVEPLLPLAWSCGAAGCPAALPHYRPAPRRDQAAAGAIASPSRLRFSLHLCAATGSVQGCHYRTHVAKLEVALPFMALCYAGHVGHGCACLSIASARMPP